ncbi:MAG: hypothetical protein GX774_07295 [Armatimonadetes bacterium]|jgi:hypothetical protein|nr:hypothetical protein [Armatimonadota bacterium]
MRWLPFAAAFVVSSLLLCGCGRSGADLTATAAAPVLRSAQISPTHLRFDFGGGTVTLQVVVDSARPLRAVTAELTRQDVAGATPRVQPLIPEGAGTFVASIPVPANIEVGGATARYRLTIYAEDSEGVRSQPLHYDIQVAAPDSSGLPGQPQ